MEHVGVMILEVDERYRSWKEHEDVLVDDV